VNAEVMVGLFLLRLELKMPEINPVVSVNAINSRYIAAVWQSFLVHSFVFLLFSSVSARGAPPFLCC
jgi:hypothetical protein